MTHDTPLSGQFGMVAPSMSFLDTVAKVKTYLQEHRRISLRGLKREFDLDDDALEELVEELTS